MNYHIHRSFLSLYRGVRSYLALVRQIFVVKVLGAQDELVKYYLLQIVCKPTRGVWGPGIFEK